MKTIYIDFETYFDKKYSLKKMSMVEYVRHPEFEVQGFAIKVDDGETRWVSGKNARLMDYVTDWQDCRVVAHNVKFDGAILAWKYGIKPAQYIDTQSMSKAVLGNSVPSHSLKALAEYLGLPAKGELNTLGKRELTEEEEKALATYCIRDTDLCHDIFNTLIKHFPDSQYQIMDWTVRTFLEPQLEIDGKKCQEVCDLQIANKAKLVASVGVEASVLRSNQQFAKLLSSEGFNVPEKKNKNGDMIPAFSVQDKGFIDMQKTTDPRLKELITARIAVKQTLEETRAKKLAEVAKVSKYCFDVIFSGAQQTHRFSGGSGCAGNPQNFGRKSALREAITVPRGKALVVADFSNIELRVLAFMSRDPELMSAIHKGEDIYCKFASKIYGYPVTKQKHKKERQLGKIAVLGLGYGMGWERFTDTVYAQTGELIDEEFAKEIVKLYRELYKGVPRFWNTCEKVLEQIATVPSYFPGVGFLKLKKNGVILPSGLELRYTNLRFTWKKMFNRWKKEWTYDRFKSKSKQMDQTKIYGGMLTENICQAVAGDVCKVAIERLIDYGTPPSGAVHDELLVVWEEDEVGMVARVVEKAMTDPMPFWKELPLAVEVGHGRNWLDAK